MGKCAIGAWCFGAAIAESFNLPIFTASVVREKEAGYLLTGKMYTFVKLTFRE
ncbi:MAG: hypothetical protein SAL07_19735 [Oscillatoria sp. PMC 1051.18]|nr:hypothetical protein [Oscillatoria sp. PMC 1051.18]